MKSSEEKVQPQYLLPMNGGVQKVILMMTMRRITFRQANDNLSDQAGRIVLIDSMVYFMGGLSVQLHLGTCRITSLFMWPDRLPPWAHQTEPL